MTSVDNSTENWGWWIGDEGDHYSSGPHPTRDHAIGAAKYERIGFEPEDQTVAFCIVEAKSNPIEFAPLFDAREWLEWIDENKLSELWDESGDTRLDQLSEADIAELQDKVVAAIQSWQVGRNVQILPYIFSDTRNADFLILAAT